MTYREQYDSSTSWQRKIIVMNLFHQLQMITYKNWNIRKTAKYFDVSIGLVSENLRIAQAFNELKELNSRKDALEKLV